MECDPLPCPGGTLYLVGNGARVLQGHCLAKGMMSEIQGAIGAWPLVC